MVQAEIQKKGRYLKRAMTCLGKVAKHRRELFVHWRFGAAFSAE
jgi:hypothetical protein